MNSYQNILLSSTFKIFNTFSKIILNNNSIIVINACVEFSLIEENGLKYLLVLYIEEKYLNIEKILLKLEKMIELYHIEEIYGIKIKENVFKRIKYSSELKRQLIIKENISLASMARDGCTLLNKYGYYEKDFDFYKNLEIIHQPLYKIIIDLLKKNKLYDEMNDISKLISLDKNYKEYNNKSPLAKCFIYAFERFNMLNLSTKNSTIKNIADTAHFLSGSGSDEIIFLKKILEELCIYAMNIKDNYLYKIKDKNNKFISAEDCYSSYMFNEKQHKIVIDYLMDTI